MSEQAITFSALYAEHAAHVWKVARCFGVPPDQLEDVTQEVWMSAFRQIPDLDLSRPLKPWLTKVVWNHVRRMRRGYARRQRKDQALKDVEATRGPSEPLSAREAKWTLELILEDLPEEQREVLLLCDGGGLSAPEVSEALGVQLNTVYSRLRLARSRSRATAATLGAAGWALLQYHAMAEPSIRELARVAEALQQASLAGGPAAGTRAASASKLHPLVYVMASGVAAIVVLVILRPTEETPIERVQPPTLLEQTDDPDERKAPPEDTLAPVPPSPDIAVPEVNEPSERKRELPRPPKQPAADPPVFFHSLAAEHSLLSAADAALTEGMPTRALQLLDEHRREFPQSANAETRDFLRIRAHCDRKDAVRARKVALEHENDPQFKNLIEIPCRSE